MIVIEYRYWYSQREKESGFSFSYAFGEHLALGGTVCHIKNRLPFLSGCTVRLASKGFFAAAGRPDQRRPKRGVSQLRPT
jgi:hypothetical protein